MKIHIPEAALQQHIAVLGKTGSGKTSTAKLIVENVVASGARVCVLDPIKSDWWGITSSADGKKPGLPFHILGGPHGHVGVHSGAGKAIGELVGAGKLPLSIIDMADLEAGGAQRFFVDFAPALLRSMRGVLYLVLEEAHEFAPKERTGFDKENMAIHFAKKLATAGRSKGLRLIVATQATQQLHNRVLGSCETMIVHRFTAPADQKPVTEWLKANTTSAAVSEIASSLSRLVAGEAWIVSGEAQIFERRKFPRIATYDNSATPTADADRHEVKTAPVDHDKLKLIIGEAVQEAEANDPKLLRVRIAQLERDARKQTTVPPPAAITNYQDAGTIRALRRALGVAVKFITTIRTIGFPDKVDAKKLQSAIEAAVEGIGAQINAEFEGHRRAFAKWQGEGEKLLAGFEKLAGDELVPIEVTVRHNEPYSVQAQPRKTAAAPAARGAVSSLPTGERRVLTAIAQHAGGVTREQLTILTGYKRSSRDTYLQRLRERGLITTAADLVNATDAGVSALGADFEPLPTGERLREHWMERLPEGERKVLTIVVAAYPDAVERETISERTDYKRSSRDTYLQRLSARRLITSERGQVRASDTLFE